MPSSDPYGDAVASPASIKVGILHDSADGPTEARLGVEAIIRSAIDVRVEAGRIDRPVELVAAYGLGLPEGTAANVERAYAELVAREVLLVVGPAIGDDALVVAPLAARQEVPTIQWSGTERARNEWMFQLQVGSHEDESVLLAQHLAERGCTRVGVVHDRSPIGRRHLAFFQAEADVVGLGVAATAAVPPLAEDAAAEVASVLDTGPDALVYFGLGLSAPAVAAAARARDWSGPRVMNTAGMRGHLPGWAAQLDGWTYVDLYADDNAVLAAVRARLGVGIDSGPFPAFGWDLGQLAAEGIARAPELTRAGVRDGLEQIKWLPAAEGHDGTLLGFGHHQRGGLHGRYLVLREWRDGRSVVSGPQERARS
jgi:branched-chain amino acid transport system substrate-binding protein